MLAAEDPVAAVLDAHVRGERLLLRTSGTGGRARGVVRSTGSWFASFPPVSELLGVDASSSVWVPGPLTATMNLFSAVHARWAGAAPADSPGTATHAVLTPATLARLLPRLPDGLRVLVAGDRLDATLHDRAVAAGLRLDHYYGAAELSFVAWGGHAGDLRPFPGAEVEAREGVLWVRSPYLCDGYDGAPGPLARDDAGFATVGDLGEVRDGRVLVRGRGDDAVTTAGATVLVTDVEAVLRVEARGDVVVVGVPHPDLGAVLAAVLTDPADQPRLVAVARAALDRAARPRAWYQVDATPLTGSGKTDRVALRALAADGLLRRLTP